MRKIATVALSSMLALTALVPVAQADRFHRSFRGHHAWGDGYHHRGRGYWHNGRWIALGVLGAAAAAAATESYRDCYWRHGVRYCDY